MYRHSKRLVGKGRQRLLQRPVQSAIHFKYLLAHLPISTTPILFVHASSSPSWLTYQQCPKSTSTEGTTYQPTMISLPRMVQILGASLYIISGNTSLCALHKQNKPQFRPLERIGREEVRSYDSPRNISFIAHILKFHSRAAERYADLTPEAYARRRQKGWGDPVSIL